MLGSGARAATARRRSRRDRWRRPQPGSAAFSPRTTRRVKSPGMVIANWTLPCAISRSSSAGRARPARRCRNRRCCCSAASIERAKAAVVLDQHRGRQVLGVGVDRVAEQQELDDRDAEDHRVGEPVADELDELLRSAPRGCARARGRVMRRCSRRRRLCAHQLDEDVLEASARPRSSGTGSRRKGAIAASSAVRSVPLTCSAGPKGATISTPGLPASSCASRSAPGPRRGR